MTAPADAPKTVRLAAFGAEPFVAHEQRVRASGKAVSSVCFTGTLPKRARPLGVKALGMDESFRLTLVELVEGVYWVLDAPRGWQPWIANVRGCSENLGITKYLR